MAEPPTFSVVVPTYRRPEVLQGCLRALHAQAREPIEVLVCRRSSDAGTADFLASAPGELRRLVREVVIGPDDNFGKSLDAGIRASVGDLVALTDDDAEAPPDWLERLAAPYADAGVAGVGGRDVILGHPPRADVVGRVAWYGRIVGNHHTGRGAQRDVDVLKGVNCSFRGELVRALGVDPRLRGAGNVVHTELSICLPLRRAGWRLVYDPAITVAHHVAPRRDGDDNHRGGFNAAAFADALYNERMLVREHLGAAGRAAYAAWALCLGTRHAPGVAQLPRVAAQRGLAEAVARFSAQARHALPRPTSGEPAPFRAAAPAGPPGGGRPA